MKLKDALSQALHNKLFSMNGYRKLQHSLENTDEVVDEVVKAVLEWLDDGDDDNFDTVRCALMFELEGVRGI